MSQTILDTSYENPTRPYSQLELLTMRHKTKKYLHLSTALINHSDCGHSYYPKKGGKKEQVLKETGEIGNCSVCWRFRKTPKHYKHIAKNIIRDYMDFIDNFSDDKRLEHYNVQLERVFHTYLYEKV